MDNKLNDSITALPCNTVQVTDCVWYEYRPLSDTVLTFRYYLVWPDSSRQSLETHRLVS
jgi:hypothetical protein